MDSAQKKKKRAKVRLEFPEKLFYEKVLIDWKESITNRNHGYVIKKALSNLKKFPLDVSGYNELKKIRGIGADIAARLDNAWKTACDAISNNGNPSLEQIRSINKGEAFFYMEASSQQQGRRKAIIPFVKNKNGTDKQDQNSSSKETLTFNADNPTSSNNLVKTNSTLGYCEQGSFDAVNISFSQPSMPTYQDRPQSSVAEPLIDYTTEFVDSIIVKASSSNISPDLWPPMSAENSQSQKSVPNWLSCEPSIYKTIGQVLLIVDYQEENARIKKRYKTICEHLSKINVNYETRRLSVGDYLWLVKLPTGEELVLDYIVERKTFDDLKHSIRDSRYSDQKRRLRECGVKNIVMIVEGQRNTDRSLEQAMISTYVEDKFLIHRTQNIQGTAKFLKRISKRLDKRCKEEKLIGPSFEQIQSFSQKSKAVIVSDCWLQQLTVCPGMSMEKAQMITQKFPSFRAMAMFYQSHSSISESEKELLLKNQVPQIPKQVSKRLYEFFKSPLPQSNTNAITNSIY